MQIGILGALEARFGDRSPPLGGTKQRAVLAMLVLAPNNLVSLDYLADGLWGDAIPDTATNVVQTYISRLRRILASGGPDDAGFGGLRRCRPGYLLEIDPECIDQVTPGPSTPEDLRPGEFLTAGEAWMLSPLTS